jgi:DNA polymerase III epsilon subunit family exonuclease
MFILRLFRAISVALETLFRRSLGGTDLSILPPHFVVFDLETTGLDASIHEIVEIGAIRVNRDSDVHQTLRALVRPKSVIPSKITELTGITNSMVARDGDSLEKALTDFLDFAGDLPLVAFNAEFDMAFLRAAALDVFPDRPIKNQVACALKMSRRAWPGLKSYRLSYLAKMGGLSLADEHRALGDCRRTLTVYTGAATKLRSAA